MSTRLGNSGRGTDGSAPPMSDEGRRKSTAASRGEHRHEHIRPHGPAERKRGKDRTDHAADVEVERPKRDHQPGGGRHSESEKPHSPHSRWGGGRGHS